MEINELLSKSGEGREALPYDCSLHIATLHIRSNRSFLLLMFVQSWKDPKIRKEMDFEDI